MIKIGLCTERDKIKSKIDLAGDPKQMDAMCQSNTAAKLGYKFSLMERLFNKPLDSKHPLTSAYNPKYITQLIQNYRSHEAILHAPKYLFYDRTLKASAPAG